jgi:hypothetical protein
MKIKLTIKQTVKIHAAYNQKMASTTMLDDVIQLILDAHNVDQKKIDLNTASLNDDILSINEKPTTL